MPSSLSAVAFPVLGGLLLSAMPAISGGPVLHLRLCGSGAPIDIPVGGDKGPARRNDGACVLACHADLRRRQGVTPFPDELA